MCELVGRCLCVFLLALADLVHGAPVHCIAEQDGAWRQVWVPDCQGEGCWANGRDKDCAWFVHDMERCTGNDCQGMSDARAKQRSVGYSVMSDSYNVDGYVCSGTETLVFFPVGTGPFPVVLYMHGSSGGVDGRQRGINLVASIGLVVIAPKTGGSGSCNSSTEWRDAVTAWTASKAGGAALNPGLAKVNWNRTGVWGYSMGGKTTPRAAVRNELGVDAMVCDHGARKSDGITVPSMYVTGTKDSYSSPAQVMFEQFSDNDAKFKVLANLQDGTHHEPTKKGTMDPWVAKFFSCHLNFELVACGQVYGTGANSLCRANQYASCIAIKDGVQEVNVTLAPFAWTSWASGLDGVSFLLILLLVAVVLH